MTRVGPGERIAATVPSVPPGPIFCPPSDSSDSSSSSESSVPQSPPARKRTSAVHGAAKTTKRAKVTAHCLEKNGSLVFKGCRMSGNVISSNGDAVLVKGQSDKTTKEEDVPGYLLTDFSGKDEKCATTDNENTCLVCLENKRQFTCADCGHFCLCIACAKKIIDQKDSIPKCPFCQTVITKQLMRTFKC